VKDSLSILSQQQIDRLTQLQRRLFAKQDSIWRPSLYLAPLPDGYNLDEAVLRVGPARQAAFDAMIDAMTEGRKFSRRNRLPISAGARSSFDIESLGGTTADEGFFPAY
jgi:hypothetical protein